MLAYVGTRKSRAPEPKGSVMLIPDKRQAVALYASAVKYDKPYVHAAARDLAAAQIADYIDKTLKGPLPLTKDQKEQIAALLNRGADA